MFIQLFKNAVIIINNIAFK